ncbi:hypothetical protein BJV74DRAFT_150512 [Russula compacta]|nr:hypothetical protein BJV74DRAFT_150512 [Russula compacta]
MAFTGAYLGPCLARSMSPPDTRSSQTISHLIRVRGCWLYVLAMLIGTLHDALCDPHRNKCIHPRWRKGIPLPTIRGQGGRCARHGGWVARVDKHMASSRTATAFVYPVPLQLTPISSVLHAFHARPSGISQGVMILLVVTCISIDSIISHYTCSVPLTCEHVHPLQSATWTGSSASSCGGRHPNVKDRLMKQRSDGSVFSLMNI